MGSSTKKKIIDTSVVVTSLLACFVCFCFNLDKRYFLCSFYPLLFAILYITFFVKSFARNCNPAKVLFCVLLFVRYVVLPIGNSIFGYTSVSKIVSSDDSYFMAEVLMIFEIIFLNITLVFFPKIFRGKTREVVTNNRTNNSRIVLYIFIAVAFIVFFFNQNLWNYIFFIVPRDGVSDKFAELSNNEQLIVFLFNIAKQLLSVLLIEKAYSLYSKSKKNRYFVMAVAAAVANIMVYDSSNRAELVFTAVTTGYLLIHYFDKYKKILYIGGIAVVSIMISFISSYRHAPIVREDSTVKSVFKSGNAYLAGVDNVAVSVEMANIYKGYNAPSNFVYDMSKGVIGLGSLVQGDDSVSTTKLYNRTFFGEYSSNISQIIPIIGQGYYYFGIFGAFLIELVFVLFALYLEKKFFFSEDFGMKYFILLFLLRLAMVQGLNGTILFNRLSYDLMVPFAVVWLNGKVHFGKKKWVKA